MKEFIDFLKLPPRILGALAIACGVLLFLPDELLGKLYMLNFRNEYGFVIGIIFVISMSILAVFLFVQIAKILKDKYECKKLKSVQRKFLKKLKGDKVDLIKVFLDDPTHTIMLPMQDALVIELTHYNVISPAGQTHAVDILYPKINYFLQPWVAERIDEDDELKSKYL